MVSTRGVVILFAALATYVHGHGAMVAVTGANGVTGEGMGIIATTPRDGTRRNPFQQDTSIIRDNEIASGTAGACGRTLAGGNNDVATEVASASDAGLPSMAADGTVSMTIHQINGDGAGPYTCEVSTDATGTSFTPMTVITNVPGRNSRSNAKATDFPLVAKAPAGTTCTGGPNGDACIVRCRNSARAGPFGGCAVVTNPETATTSAAAAASTTVAAAAETSTAAAAETTAAAAETTAAAAAETTATAEATATATEAAAATATDAAAADNAAAGDGAAVADVANTPAAGPGSKIKDALQGLLGRFFAERDLSRRRLVRSRIVEEHKRNVWI